MPPFNHLLRTRRLAAGALAIIVLGSLVTGLNAATVQGRLDNNNGTPAGAITVKLTAASGKPAPGFSAFSVRNGMYYFSHIPAGAYVLEVWRNNVMVHQRRFAVPESIYNVPVIRLP